MSAPAWGTTGSAEQSTGTAHNIPVPASVASGDIIVVAMFVDGSTVTVSTLPSGFAHAENSPLTVAAGSAGNHSLNVMWKRASAADTGTYAFVISSSVFAESNAVRYTGCVASGNPWDSPTNAVDGGTTGATNTPNVAISTQGPDRLNVFVGTNWGGGAWTPAVGWNERVDNSNSLTVDDLVQAAQGSTGNIHATDAATAQTGAWLGALIGTTVSGSIPPPQPRYPQYRDYGEVQWTQGNRLNANLVATAANPLPSPLDAAWQAGGRYNHLYGDIALRPSLAYYAQKDRRDANSLGAVVTDPLTLAAGVGGDTWRRYATPDLADRREMPQQRAYVSDPLLLGTALLENELLGGANTGKRYLLPASNVDRREVPQQRAYVSDPLLLTVAQLENELLGGAETTKRVNTPVTHAPRWWMPEQPARQSLSFDGGPDVPPLTLSWGVDGRYSTLYSQPAWQPDRRQVPQQRAYISDPSFYPLLPPTDPLTVAWGAGGAYWHLYFTAATHTDRREVPQQRTYISDPLLLNQALLENELLGSADDRWRRFGQWPTDRREVPQQRVYISDPTLLTPAGVDPLTLAAGVGGDLWRRVNTPAYADRREMPQQRSYLSDPTFLPPLADPLLLLSDTWRRYSTPAYADRREVPQQPPRWTLYFDAGPGSTPLTLAWGAGGSLWHSYQWRREARSWWQPRLLYTPLGDPCIIVRPTTGTTTEPSTGITARPNTGTTVDPCNL